ncbi:YiiX/YebB-like N1pC/P60 family cysteine hydrolase [Flavobacterium sp. ZB4R12]|uniref:YiiX/YebB-like N1pC/P60 family cysteine hydrolase n=1 Tax=Flavobacterium sp. ZB4R12 TaxID=3398732 RepID=UPI003AACB4B1
MTKIIRKDKSYKLNELPELANNSFVVNNIIGFTGSILSRPIENTLNIYKHFAIVYGFDRRNILWVIENNTNGVECITFNDFLNGQHNYKVERYINNSFQSNLILQRAKEKANEIYNPTIFNCEHFVNFCHTGNSQSKQVDVTKVVVNAAISYYELKVSYTNKNEELLESLNKTRKSLDIERSPEFQKTLDENISKK